MDLLALAAADERVHVFRLNGQKVFGVAKKESVGRITDIKWKPNGQSIAVAIGNSLCIVSAHTGKTMYEKEYTTSSKAPICCLGWASNFTDVAAVRERMANLEHSVAMDESTASEETGNSQYAPDLPIELAFVDIASVLPKLSTLPVAGTQGDIFSSRLSLDTLFKPLPTGSADRADLLIVGHEDGTIHLSMSEDFSIGTLRLKDAGPSLSTSKPFLHSSHPLSTTHALLASTASKGIQELQLVPFDLRLISIAGRELSLLASKVTELHNLQRYLRQVQAQISGEIRTSQDLPSRFMRNINETLLEKSDCTWVDAAYHLVVTGHCYSEVKEWLVDELGERGHKRWDKAVNLGYENVRRLTHESLLPALDRLSVLISRLRGLSRFQSSDFSLGLSTLELDNMLDSMNCLQLLAHQLLKCVVSELQRFGAFSTWLRHEIEKQAAEPASASAQEIAEKDMSFDHISILEYIQGAMTNSQMLAYTANTEDGGRAWDLEVEGGLLFELYKKDMDEVSSGLRSQRRLPGLSGLIDHFQKQSNVLFERISETQRRNVHIGAPISLGAGNPTCADMRMVDEGVTTGADFSIYVALGQSPKGDCVKLFRVGFVVENGVSSTKSVACVRIPVPMGAVRDLKFIDDYSLMLAFVGIDDVSCLVKLSYRFSEQSGHDLRYRHVSLAGVTDADESSRNMSGEACGIDLTKPNEVSLHAVHQFPAGKMWTPQKLEINGRKGRRMVCVLAEDRHHYRQFDLDSLATSHDKTAGDDENGHHDADMTAS